MPIRGQRDDSQCDRVRRHRLCAARVGTVLHIPEHLVPSRNAVVVVQRFEQPKGKQTNQYSKTKTINAISKQIYPIERKYDVGMDAKHLPKRVLVVTRLHVTIQHVLQHIEESRIEFLDLDFALGLQTQRRGRAVGPCALIHSLFRCNYLRPLVDASQPFAQDCM